MVPGENRQHGCVWVEHAGLEHLRMLQHTSVERDVVILGPAAERMQQKHGVLEAAIKQILMCLLHEQGMAIVDGITQLEGIHGIGLPLLELGAQLRKMMKT